MRYTDAMDSSYSAIRNEGNLDIYDIVDGLEGIRLSEVRERQILCDLLDMWNLKINK